MLVFISQFQVGLGLINGQKTCPCKDTGTFNFLLMTQKTVAENSEGCFIIFILNEFFHCFIMNESGHS